MDHPQEFSIQEVHVSTIRCGDIIMCPDGKIRTVTEEFIKHDRFIGDSLFGDCYRLGTTPVKKLTYKKPNKIT